MVEVHHVIEESVFLYSVGQDGNHGDAVAGTGDNMTASRGLHGQGAIMAR